MSAEEPPPYEATPLLSSDPQRGTGLSVFGNSNDPRTSSTQSLVPTDINQGNGKRTLLLIYIHGFMGDDTSFRSFPAHVHNVLSITLQDSHLVHSKVYPHYRSRRPIADAVEAFSTWLEPHESPMTDVILLSHSMGGLLAADVALLLPKRPIPGVVFRHRILGLMNFDVPFLGIHPGVIPAGLSSIFKPWPEPPEDQQQAGTVNNTDGSPSQNPPARADTLFSPPSDSTFNPSFSNDVHVAVRKGWQGPLHFVKKHSDNILAASRNYVKSHVQFGSAMADYPTLKARYQRIRPMEDERVEARKAVTGRSDVVPPRIRFINYWTASHGRPKKPKASPQEDSSSLNPSTLDLNSQMNTLSVSSRSSPSPSLHSSPRISTDKPEDDREHLGETGVEEKSRASTQNAAADAGVQSNPQGSNSSFLEHEAGGPVLPEIPPVPAVPPFPTQEFPDEKSKKEAEKQYSQAMKDYKHAVKERNKIIKECGKIIAQAEEEGRPISKAPRTPSPHQALPNPSSSTTALTNPSEISLPHHGYALSPQQSTQGSIMSTVPSVDSHQIGTPRPAPKKIKDKKFCVLPSKNSDGTRDRVWVRVFMRDMDEVGAHTGLFFLGETYEQLVGDTAARIESWVGEDMTRRLVEDLGEGS